MHVQEPAATALGILASLHGHTIERVIYREIAYESGAPEYIATDHHSLDYGLELHLSSGKIVSFIWRWPVCYFLGVLDGDLSSESSDGHAIWDVSNDPRWAGLTRRRIDRTRLEWFRDDEQDGDFPLTAKIAIEGDAVFYVSLEKQMTTWRCCFRTRLRERIAAFSMTPGSARIGDDASDAQMHGTKLTRSRHAAARAKCVAPVGTPPNGCRS